MSLTVRVRKPGNGVRRRCALVLLTLGLSAPLVDLAADEVTPVSWTSPFNLFGRENRPTFEFVPVQYISPIPTLRAPAPPADPSLSLTSPTQAAPGSGDIQFSTPPSNWGQPREWIPPPNPFPDGSTIERLPPLESDPPFVEPPVVDDPERFPYLSYVARQVLHDHLNYYSARTARIYVLSFGVGAILANTSLDEDFRNGYQDSIGRNEFIHGFKVFGEGKIVLPSYCAAAVIGYWFDERPATSWLGQWGQRSLRATAVGTPSMLLMQYVTGGSRPGENPYNSAWRPFEDVNGVSGHAFMGAIPFITAAQMTERPLLKASLYGLSTMTGWSRVNDDDHYLSQIILGWWMAYASTAAVYETQSNANFQIVPYSHASGQGVLLEWRR